MDQLAEERLLWIVTWADSIQGEVAKLSKLIEGEREEILNLHTAAIELRQKAEALQGKLTLKPGAQVEETPEPVTQDDIIILGAGTTAPDETAPVPVEELKYPDQWPQVNDTGFKPAIEGDPAGDVLATGAAVEEVVKPPEDLHVAGDKVKKGSQEGTKKGG